MIDFKKSYNREDYIKFFQNDFFTNDFQRMKESIDIYSFKPKYIEEAVLIGEDKSLDNLKIYEIKHKKELDIRYRVGLTKEAGKIMFSYGNSKALCVFHTPDKDNYRLSLMTIDIELDDKKTKKYFSNPKRFSFYLGNDAKTVTPEQFLIKKGKISDFEDLKNRFSIEIVNKEFYNNIAHLFNELVGGKRYNGKKKVDYGDGLLKLPENLSHQKMQEFGVRLIGRLIFCWFLKKKLSENNKPLINEEVLSKKSVAEYKNYYHDILEKLFFKVLNTKNNLRDNEIQSSIFKDIPFLNGGLFDPHNEDFFNGQRNDKLIVPNKWFLELFEVLETYNFTIDENTASDIELSIDPEMLGRIFENLLAEINPETGETARKSSGSYYTPRPIVDNMVTESLKQYLITKTDINEEKITNIFDDWTEDDEVSINFEEAKSIKDELFNLKIIDPACGSAAFPMGILHKVLTVHLNIDKYILTKAKDLSKKKSDENLYIKKGQKIYYSPDNKDKDLYIECIYKGNYDFEYSINLDNKIIDDGIQKVNNVARIIKSFLNYYKTKNNISTIANLFSQGKLEGEDVSFITLRNNRNIKRLVDIDDKDKIIWEWKDYNVSHKTRKTETEINDDASENFLSDENSFNNYVYDLKEKIVKDTIFGVDIQPIAVEISKLRTFLSLIVDEKVNDEKENRDIEPLPNLEFKFVSANSLIGLPQITDKETNMFEDLRPIQKLKEIRDNYFNSYGKYKEELKNNFIRTLEAIKKSKAFYDYNNIKDLKIADWNPFSDEPAEWFDPEWMFGVKDGFDIVIANPPYGIMNKKQNKNESIIVSDEDLAFYKDSSYYEPASGGMLNIFRLFILKSIYLLTNDGVFSEIFPLSFMGDLSIKKLRKHILNNYEILFIEAFPERDNPNKRIFEAAKMSVCILNLRKRKSNNSFFVRINTDRFIDESAEKNYLTKEMINILNQENSSFPLSSPKETQLLLQIFSRSINFSNIGKCSEGEVHMTFCKNSFSYNSKDPVLLKGAIIDRYQLRTKMSQGEIVFISEEILFSIKKNLLKDIKKTERIVSQGITGVNESLRLKFMIIKDAYCANSLNYLILKKNIDKKYLLGILNSKLLNFIFSKFSTNSNVNGYEIENLPYPNVDNDKAKIEIINNVTNILKIKKQNPDTDTIEFEKKIDLIVYNLYELTYDEVKIIEPDFYLSKEEYENFKN